MLICIAAFSSVTRQAAAVEGDKTRRIFKQSTSVPAEWRKRERESEQRTRKTHERNSLLWGIFGNTIEPLQQRRRRRGNILPFHEQHNQAAVLVNQQCVRREGTLRGDSSRITPLSFTASDILIAGAQRLARLLMDLAPRKPALPRRPTRPHTLVFHRK